MAKLSSSKNTSNIFIGVNDVAWDKHFYRAALRGSQEDSEGDSEYFGVRCLLICISVLHERY